MSHPAILLIGLLAAITLVGTCYAHARHRLDRRTARRILALAPPVATLSMALIAGSWAAVLPLFIFGGVIGILAALSSDQFWHPI